MFQSDLKFSKSPSFRLRKALMPLHIVISSICFTNQPLLVAKIKQRKKKHQLKSLLFIYILLLHKYWINFHLWSIREDEQKFPLGFKFLFQCLTTWSFANTRFFSFVRRTCSFARDLHMPVGRVKRLSASGSIFESRLPFSHPLQTDLVQSWPMKRHGYLAVSTFVICNSINYQ